MPTAHEESRLRQGGHDAGPMTLSAKSGDDQRIEVQYTFEDGDALARTLDAASPAQGEKELEAGLGGTSASIQRVSRRPR